MFRIVILAIGSISALIILIPVILIFQLFRKNKCFYQVCLVVLFTCFLTGIFVTTRVPAINELVVDASINIIPFIDIINTPFQYILNIILFVPIGFISPLIWNRFYKAKNTILLGFVLSLFIEIMQIFTFRNTDIDDLIMNTLGTAIGYFSARLFIYKIMRQNKKGGEISNNGLEVYSICLLTFAVVFIISPIISSFIWSKIL